ncbi:MAG: ATP-binding protein [Pseudomonadota bacterium]|nr:ATP-binding protein [Pseudomonadota bacterium]
MSSIRHRLLLSLVIGLLVSTAMMIGVAYIDTTDELQELFTDNLRRMAVVLKAEAFSTGTQPDPTDTDGGEVEESYLIQLWDEKGVLQRSSRPEIPLPLQQKVGLSHLLMGRQTWDVYTEKEADRGYVQIAQPQKIVTTMIGESALRALQPLLLLFFSLLLGIWYAVGRSLRPLDDLSKKIGNWSVDKMEPLSPEKTPQEIKPLVGALNGMLLKLEKAMAMQRQFTADAAHELRTPLTAIKLQLDNLIRAPSEVARTDAVGKLSHGIDRCIRLANQLLTASRSLAVKQAPDVQKVRLQELIRTSMTTFVVLAQAKDIDMVFESDAEVEIFGEEEGLRVLVNNLLDNAIRHAPPKGHVTVQLSRASGQAILEVSDDGPGIPVAERDKIFQRFYRIPGTAQTGSGLGLSIVKNVADAHHASITVSDRAGQSGTVMRLAFPT